MKYLALFDWDHTVRKNYAYDIFINTLIKNNIIDKNILVINDLRRNDYINGQITHDQLAMDGIKVYRSIYKWYRL